MTSQAANSLWATLGIAATQDRAAIRRAYAARLKLVQPEDDPEGFKQLRAAYEQAMTLAERAMATAARAAQQAVQEKAPDVPTPPPEPALREATAQAAAAEAPAHRELAIAEAPAPVAEREPAIATEAPAPSATPQLPLGRPAHQAAHEAACNRLAALLTAQSPPPADELGDGLRAVLTSPALDELSTHLQTETWLARLICHTVPRSDAIVEPAAAAFGWKPDALYVADAGVAGAIARLSALENSRLLARLDAMLRGPAEPEENKLFGVLDKITAPSVIRQPQQGPQIEVALARMLLDTRPRSDAVMAIVARRLGWAAPARQASADPAIVEAGKVAGQIAPRSQASAPRAAGARRRVRAGFHAIWLVFALFAGVSYCSSQVSQVTSASGQQTDAGSEGGSQGSRPQATFYRIKSPDGTRHEIDMTISSANAGYALLQCVAGDGRLRDCSTVDAVNNSKGETARYFAMRLAWTSDEKEAPAVGDRVLVQVRFLGV